MCDYSDGVKKLINYNGHPTTNHKIPDSVSDYINSFYQNDSSIISHVQEIVTEQSERRFSNYLNVNSVHIPNQEKISLPDCVTVDGKCIFKFRVAMSGQDTNSFQNRQKWLSDKCLDALKNAQCINYSFVCDQLGCNPLNFAVLCPDNPCLYMLGIDSVEALYEMMKKSDMAIDWNLYHNVDALIIYVSASTSEYTPRIFIISKKGIKDDVTHYFKRIDGHIQVDSIINNEYNSVHTTLEPFSHSPMSKLQYAIMTHGMLDREGNKKSIDNLIEENNKNNVIGIVYHYASYDCLKSIVEGKQLRLTHFKRMKMGGLEGKHIFTLLSKAISNLSKELTNEQKSILEIKAKSLNEKVNHGIVPHYLSDTNETEDCIPYAFCFTIADDRSGPKWLVDRDVCFIFQSGDLGLEICKMNNFTISHDCYGAMVFNKIRYGEDLLSELEDTILHYYKYVDDDDLASNCILQFICKYVPFTLSENYNGEVERRLVFYVPVDREKHMNIIENLNKKRIKDNEGNMIEEDDNNDSFIYLNFSNLYKYMQIVFNPDSEKDLSSYEKIIADNNLEPIVFDRSWRK